MQVARVLNLLGLQDIYTMVPGLGCGKMSNNSANGASSACAVL